jgi:hypothetical protein
MPRPYRTRATCGNPAARLGLCRRPSLAAIHRPAVEHRLTGGRPITFVSVQRRREAIRKCAASASPVWTVRVRHYKRQGAGLVTDRSSLWAGRLGIKRLSWGRRI